MWAGINPKQTTSKHLNSGRLLRAGRSCSDSSRDRRFYLSEKQHLELRQSREMQPTDNCSKKS